MGLLIDNPVVVAKGNDLYLIASDNVSEDSNTDAQTWDSENGYSEVKPLQVWFKFLYYMDDVIPPEQWVEPT